jgi:hypothetical protein
VTGLRGFRVTGFVLLRVRAHRLLLAAALLAVVLTTSVLATLAAFGGSVGDAGPRRDLRGQEPPRSRRTRVAGPCGRVATDSALAAAGLGPTTLLVSGPRGDGGALRAAAHRAGPGLSVAVRSGQLARYTGSPLQSGARRVYLTAVAAAAAGEPGARSTDAVPRAGPVSLLVPSAALLVPACAVPAVQTWLGARRGEGMDLRIGERT